MQGPRPGRPRSLRPASWRKPVPVESAGNDESAGRNKQLDSALDDKSLKGSNRLLGSALRLFVNLQASNTSTFFPLLARRGRSTQHCLAHFAPHDNCVGVTRVRQCQIKRTQVTPHDPPWVVFEFIASLVFSIL